MPMTSARDFSRAPSAPRAYLLIEMMVASGLLAVALSSAIDLIASARVDVTMASNRQTAAALARQKCDAIATTLPSATTDQSTLTAVNSSTFKSFKWKWTTTTSTIGTSSTPNISRAAREIVCTVQYPTTKSNLEDRAATPDGDGLATYAVSRMWFDTSQ